MDQICKVCGNKPEFEFKGMSLCRGCFLAYRYGYFDAMSKIRAFTRDMLNDQEYKSD